jgi:hypothetical protein
MCPLCSPTAAGWLATQREHSSAATASDSSHYLDVLAAAASHQRSHCPSVQHRPPLQALGCLRAEVSCSRCSLVSACMVTARQSQMNVKGELEAVTPHGSILAASQALSSTPEA